MAHASSHEKESSIYVQVKRVGATYTYTYAYIHILIHIYMYLHTCTHIYRYIQITHRRQESESFRSGGASPNSDLDVLEFLPSSAFCMFSNTCLQRERE